MKCGKCGKNEATMYYKETVNGKMREMHLCPVCAQELNVGTEFESAFAGAQSMFAGFGGFFGEAFPSLSGGGFAPPQQGGAGIRRMAGTERECPACGMTESKLRRFGRAGCAACYQSFADLLVPYIRKVQGAESHLGAKPQTADEAAAPAAKETQADPIEALRAQQQAAVQSENYEEAARLRDEIKRLEGTEQ